MMAFILQHHQLKLKKHKNYAYTSTCTHVVKNLHNDNIHNVHVQCTK